MNPVIPTHNSLEDFVERHRADFDVHEPRPDLWAALEQQLTAPVSHVVPTQAAAPTWLRRYGIAAGLAVLAGAAGYWSRPAAPAAPADTSLLATFATVTPGQPATGNAVPLPANYSDSATVAQLLAAVQGLETYYVTQLQRRETQLRELGDTSAVPGGRTHWQQQLSSLDSSYRQLKRELRYHPQPELLLTAMNRNLQFRLDLLDQQLAAAPVPDATRTSSGFVLAGGR